MGPWEGHIYARRLPQSTLLGQTLYYVCVFNGLRADDFERCTSIERYANSNEAVRKPFLCILTFTVSTHSERMQSVQQTTHLGLRVLAWRIRKV